MGKQKVSGGQVFISEADQYLFAQGTHYDIYKKLGAHISVENGVKGMFFGVWAPNAASVHVIGTFNGWDEQAHPMTKLGPGGIHTVFIPGVGEGELYKFLITAPDGEKLYMGRNNRQNDELTFRLASKGDIWLHAQKVHGSHVIIAANGRPVPDDTITQAAQLAAYHSELRLGKNVSVDVTPVKQIKRPPGAKPGMVIYHTYRTVIVNPYENIVKEVETGKPRG